MTACGCSPPRPTLGGSPGRRAGWRCRCWTNGPSWTASSSWYARTGAGCPVTAVKEACTCALHVRHHPITRRRPTGTRHRRRHRQPGRALLRLRGHRDQALGEHRLHAGGRGGNRRGQVRRELRRRPRRTGAGTTTRLRPGPLRRRRRAPLVGGVRNDEPRSRHRTASSSPRVWAPSWRASPGTASWSSPPSTACRRSSGGWAWMSWAVVAGTGRSPKFLRPGQRRLSPR